VASALLQQVEKQVLRQ